MAGAAFGLCALIIIAHGARHSNQAAAETTRQPTACATSLALARSGACSGASSHRLDRAWVATLSPQLAARKMQLVAIGPGKGLGINVFLGAFQRGWNASNADWLSFQSRASPRKGRRPAVLRGGACSGHPVAGWLPRNRTARARGSAVRVLAVETLNKSSVALRSTAAHFRAPLDVVHGAAATHGRAGGVSTAPVVTVDALLRARGVTAVDLLSIEAGGDDALVLRGAEVRPVQHNSLSARQAPYAPHALAHLGHPACAARSRPRVQLRRRLATAQRQPRGGAMHPHSIASAELGTTLTGSVAAAGRVRMLLAVGRPRALAIRPRLRLRHAPQGVGGLQP